MSSDLRERFSILLKERNTMDRIHRAIIGVIKVDKGNKTSYDGMTRRGADYKSDEDKSIARFRRDRYNEHTLPVGNWEFSKALRAVELYAARMEPRELKDIAGIVRHWVEENPSRVNNSEEIRTINDRYVSQTWRFYRFNKYGNYALDEFRA